MDILQWVMIEYNTPCEISDMNIWEFLEFDMPKRFEGIFAINLEGIVNCE